MSDADTPENLGFDFAPAWARKSADEYVSRYQSKSYDERTGREERPRREGDFRDRPPRPATVPPSCGAMSRIAAKMSVARRPPPPKWQDLRSSAFGTRFAKGLVCIPHGVRGINEIVKHGNK